MGTVAGVLAVDLGRTNLRVAAISPFGEMLLRETLRREPRKGTNRSSTAWPNSARRSQPGPVLPRMPRSESLRRDRSTPSPAW